MKKIWLIYYSKTGNCQALCDEVGSKLSENFEVKTRNVEQIKLEDIVNDSPDALLVGSRIVIGNPDKTIKKFVKKIGSKLSKPIPKAATLYTHGSSWKDSYGKMTKILKENDVVEEIFSEILEIKLDGNRGPAEPGQENKISVFVENISNFIQD